MSKTIIFNTLGMDDEAFVSSFMEGDEQAETEDYERHLKWLRELIENRDGECAREQDKRQKQAMKQAMIYWDD